MTHETSMSYGGTKADHRERKMKLVAVAWGVLRNHTCCGNDDTTSGRWHVHAPGHPWQGIDVPSNLRLQVDPNLGDAGLLLVPLKPECISPLGVGQPCVNIDETLAARGVTAGPSVTVDTVRIGFGRNGAALSPYSNYVKGDAANLWFKHFAVVAD